MDAPSYLVDALRFAAGYENVTNWAEAMIEFRQRATAREIAFFEYCFQVPAKRIGHKPW